MSRIWFDTEFMEDGKTIDLLSIGLVNEKGEHLYLENSDCDHLKADQWVKDNVFPFMKGNAIPKKEIAQKVLEFAGPNPEFWAYYADYDWVVLCQLFGRMVDLPNHWPKYCRDLKQVMDEVNFLSSPIPNLMEHNALSDAIWTMQTHIYVEAVSLENK
jgi:hypothetical protein